MSTKTRDDAAIRRRLDKNAGPTRSRQVRAALEREILSGKLKPGSRISEESVCARYGVSRTPVREALKHLSSEGFVDIRPHQGACVAQLATGVLIETFELMSLLEADCAALAARRGTPEDHKALVAAHDACKRAAKRNDARAFYIANARFHESIYRASHNTLLEAQTLALRNRLEPYRRETTFHAGLMSLSLREHEAILEAIVQMQESAARSSMHGHLDTLRNDAVATVEAIRRGNAA